MNLQQLRGLAAHCGTPYMPVFAYLHVYSTPVGNRLQVGNGRYTVDAPTDLPPMTVDAGRLLAALSACDNDTVLSVTDSNVLVRGGRVKARIPLVDTDYPVSTPTPTVAQTVQRTGLALPHDLAALVKATMAALEALQPLVAEDASRPWATAVCLSGDFAYATNNVVLARHPAPGPCVPAVNLPGSAIPVILAQGAAVDIGTDEHSATFYYADGSWIKTGLISGDWPTATVDNFVDGLSDEWLPVHESLSSVCEAAAKFSVDKFPVLNMSAAGVALDGDAFVAEDLGELPEAGRVNARMAGLVFAMAEGVQWHTPKKDMHVFKAGQMVGVFAGTR